MNVKVEQFQTLNNYNGIIKHVDLNPSVYDSKSFGNKEWYCGYVEIPNEYTHLFDDKDFIENHFDVHGGITFNEYNKDDIAPEVNNKYLLGFDCNHWDDIMNPKDKQFVIKEINRLALQVEKYIKGEY